MSVEIVLRFVIIALLLSAFVRTIYKLFKRPKKCKDNTPKKDTASSPVEKEKANDNKKERPTNEVKLHDELFQSDIMIRVGNSIDFRKTITQYRALFLTAIGAITIYVNTSPYPDGISNLFLWLQIFFVIPIYVLDRYYVSLDQRNRLSTLAIVEYFRYRIHEATPSVLTPTLFKDDTDPGIWSKIKDIFNPLYEHVIIYYPISIGFLLLDYFKYPK